MGFKGRAAPEARVPIRRAARAQRMALRTPRCWAKKPISGAQRAFAMHGEKEAAVAHVHDRREVLQRIVRQLRLHERIDGERAVRAG